MLAAYKYNQNRVYLDSVIKACDWLCKIQDEGGYWEKNAFMNVPRVYDSYVDAPLLQAYQHTGNELYKEKALKNLYWIIEKKQLENGWFVDCDNTIRRNDKPILHTISYTIDGLLDCGIFLNNEKILNAARLSADKLLEIFSDKKFLNGRFDHNWHGSEYLITTGCAQIALIWLKLFKLTGNSQYFSAANSMNNLLMYVQNRKVSETNDTKGALPGSFPVWGKYEPFCFPNWATKYFADSLLMEQNLKSE